MRKLVLAGFLLSLFWGCRQQKEIKKVVSKPEIPQGDTVASYEYDSFGLRIDSMQVEEHRVKRNESLYLILDKYNFSPREIYTLTQKANDLIDVRSLKPGQKYRMYVSADTNATIQRMLWQPNALEYVVFDWQSDSLKVFKASRTLSTESAVASGEITNSLYEATTQNGTSPLLAYKLADIFAWQIDFFGLREGDSFKALYNKKYIGDNFYNTGEVLAAEFTHRGEVYKAYKFTQSSTDGYFTETGESVEKALLKAPFKFSQRISSRFDSDRMHPILGVRRPHYGVDYAAPYGAPVLSVGDGVVTEADYGRGSGNMVKIKHNATYKTAYMHLSDFADGVYSGASVKQGQVIGYVGSTGLATGPHLHYTLYKNNRPVNSLAVELPSSESVPDSLMDAFTKRRDALNHRMNEKFEKPKNIHPVMTFIK